MTNWYQLEELEREDPNNTQRSHKLIDKRDEIFLGIDNPPELTKLSEVYDPHLFLPTKNQQKTSLQQQLENIYTSKTNPSDKLFKSPARITPPHPDTYETRRQTEDIILSSFGF